MTDIGELVNVNLIDAQHQKACPFCYKSPHAFPSKKEDASDEVASKPSQLACDDVPNGGEGKHTTAKHHLICAIQCYAQVKRLVRMGSMVGYDINDPPNGIGLPTFKNKYRVTPTSPQKKYSELDDDEKRIVAFRVMDSTRAQWHVGHHSFEIKLPDDWDVDEGGPSGEAAHQVSYDTSVIKRLLAIMKSWVAAKHCEDPKDKSQELKADMDKLSSDLKTKLQKFDTGQPKDSSPYFVSERAFDYAKSRATP